VNGSVEALSVTAAVATAVQAGALVALHLLPTGYNPVRDAVSDYGVGRYRSVFWLQAVAGGVGSLALAVALAQLDPFTPDLVVIMLAVSAVARFLIPFFRTDQGDSRFETVPGRVHMLLAVVSFGGLTVAATSLWHTLRHYAAWHSAKGWLTITPWVMLGSVAALVLALRVPRLERHFGLYERLFYASSIAWVLVVAIKLARIAG
jgi:hypothetical protein